MFVPYSINPRTAIARGAATAKAIFGANPEPALSGTGEAEPEGVALAAEPDSEAPVLEAVGETVVEELPPLDDCESSYCFTTN